jgi:hypothetical protein
LIARLRTLLLIPLLALLAAACSTNVAIDMPTIPKPVVDKFPLKVAVRIPQEFEGYVHEEEVLGREDWSISLGRSNAALFTQLFAHLFEETIVLKPEEDANQFTFDALIEPSIDGFEFSTPAQSQTNAYAVWIRYRLIIFDSAGNKFANWPVSAYGKSQKEGIGGSDSLQRAAVLAMRDAAALMVTQLEKATGLSALADGPLETPDADDKTQQALVAGGRTEQETIRAIVATGLGGFPNERSN